MAAPAGDRLAARRRVAWLTLLALSATLSVAVFVRLTRSVPASDILPHARIATAEFRSGRWFTYTLWSPLLILVAGNGHLLSLRAASVLLLTAAVLAKLIVARRALVAWGAPYRQAVAVAAGLVLATPLLGIGDPARNSVAVTTFPRGSIYLGRLTATVWHNSTTIASLPVIVVAAMAARRTTARHGVRAMAVVGALVALSALVKPNWALVALPVFAVVTLIEARRARRGFGGLVGLLAVLGGPTAAVLVIQLALVRSDPFVVSTRFTFDPLLVWRHYAASPWRATVQSLAFPLAATAVAIVRDRRLSRWLVTCWAAMAVAIAQLALLGERNRTTGLPVWDGNWFWGADAACLVLFLAAAAELAGRPGARAPGPRSGSGVRAATVAAWLVFGLHVATGAVYVLRLFTHEVGFAT